MVLKSEIIHKLARYYSKKAVCYRAAHTHAGGTSAPSNYCLYYIGGRKRNNRTLFTPYTSPSSLRERVHKSTGYLDPYVCSNKFFLRVRDAR